MNIEQTIRALEEQLARTEPRVPRAELERLVADDFSEIGTSGRVYRKREAIDALVAAPARQPVALQDFRVTELAAGVALATYRTPGSLRSSIWRREGSAWRIVFHQGTPIH